jgi:hypothetical protein
MMNTVLAVGVGVAIFVLGQVLLRFFLEPMQEQRRIIGEIASALVYLANIHNLDRVTAEGYKLQYPEEPADASRTLRRLASNLRATLETVPFYNFWARLRFVRKRADVLAAMSGLVGCARKH